MATPSSATNDVTYSGHVTNVTSSMWAEPSGGGELLWLWYVVFTFVLLGLILMSFVRFHYKRGQQQKLRLDAELSGYAVKRRHMTPSSSFTNHVTASPAALVNLDTQKLLTSHHNDVRGHRRSRGREDGDVRRSTPVVYMFNANGSMVDVRCEQTEICNTFRFDNGYDTADDHQHIHLHSGDFDLEDFKDIDKSGRRKSCMKSSYDLLTSRSLADGEILQPNHDTYSSPVHLHRHHHHHNQQQQYSKQRTSPTPHRHRHRHIAMSSAAAARTSLLHPSRFGREYLASSDEELSRSAAAAEALILWQKR